MRSATPSKSDTSSGARPSASKASMICSCAQGCFSRQRTSSNGSYRPGQSGFAPPWHEVPGRARSLRSSQRRLARNDELRSYVFRRSRCGVDALTVVSDFVVVLLAHSDYLHCVLAHEIAQCVPPSSNHSGCEWPKSASHRFVNSGAMLQTFPRRNDSHPNLGHSLCVSLQ